MLENVRLAFQGIWSHKMRSFLTMLGIIIGIASIISIVSTIKGTNDELRDKLLGSGNHAVEVNLSQGGEDYTIYSGSSIPSGIPVVSESTKEDILALDSVDRVTCYTKRFISDSVYYGDTALTQFNIFGIDDQYFDTLGYKLKSGRLFMEDDYRNFRKVLVLDQVSARKLFGDESPLGKTIEISSQPFTVVGVVYDPADVAPDISNLSEYYSISTDSNGVFYMPKASWPIVYCYDEPENVVVKAHSINDMTTAGQKTEDILNKTITSTSSQVKYKAQDLLGTLKSKQAVTNTQNMQLIWIAGISLLVGGIGVMNIMLVSVTERTSEIGLKKAIGAPKSMILGQFLTEAAVLTSLGGLLGVGAGVLMAYLIHRFSDIPVAIDIPAAVIAVLFSMVIGIVFGLLPSVKAANLDPIEALRRE